MKYYENYTTIQKSDVEIAPESKTLFSYLLSPDAPKYGNSHSLKKHQKEIIDTFSNTAFERYESAKTYCNSLMLLTKDNGYRLLDYNLMMQHKIKDDINFKNSYIKYAYETIAEPMPIFVSPTLPSEYHPFSRQGALNPSLHTETIEQQKEAFDALIYRGYCKLEDSFEDFYKSRLFREGGLTKNKRASILAYEPHKSFVAHAHRLEIIEGNYIVEYIEQILHNHAKHGLGRTEIALFEKSFNMVKHLYTLKYETDKNGSLIGWLNDKVYFKVLVQQSATEIQSISNYMTSYIEQQHIIEDRDRDSKKNPVVYSAFAYYLASLKDKFEPSEDLNPHKKIRRIRYAQLLISREVYRSIMTKEFISFLDSIGHSHKQNMYYHVTKLLKAKRLNVYKYYGISNETGLIDMDKVMFYKTEMEGFEQFIDTMQNTLFRVKEKAGKTHLSPMSLRQKIHLDYDDHLIKHYGSDREDEFVIYDLPF